MKRLLGHLEVKNNFGKLAQLVEHLYDKQDVIGSNPVHSYINYVKNGKTLTTIKNKLPNTIQLRLNIVYQKPPKWMIID